MDDSYLNNDFDSSSEKMEYLEEANQSAVREIHRLQNLVEDKEHEVSDLSKLNLALMGQLEEQGKVVADLERRSHNMDMMEHLEEERQSSLKEIDRLQSSLSEKKSILDDVGQLSEALMSQVEEKNKLLSGLEKKVYELEKEQLIVHKDNSISEISDKEKIHAERFKASIAVSEKQIAILRKVIVAKQYSN